MACLLMVRVINLGSEGPYMVLSTSVDAVAGRVGVNPRELKRFIKFACVGIIGAVVDFGTFNLLLNPMAALLMQAQSGWLAPFAMSELGIVSLAATIAATISFVLAIISNFIWNRYWTYPDSRSKSLRRQFVQFFVVNASGIVLRIPIVRFSLPLLTRLALGVTLTAPYALRIGSNLAVAIAVGVVMFWNFFANRYWTYNDVQ